jgi:hypothetical protein
MAFEHFTRCVAPADYVPRSYAVMAGQAAIITSLGGILVLALGDVSCLLILAEIYGLAFLIAYCRNWLYGRLICLSPDDQHVVGAVISVSPPPGPLARDWDDDYSINLLLRNTEFGVSQQVAQNSQPYGFLIHPQDVITNPPVNRETPGHDAFDKATQTTSWGLHAEFEGGGNYNLMKVSEGLLGFCVGALVACVFLPFPIDLILGLFILLAGLLGIIASKFARPGSPSDVNPDIPEIHTNTESNGGHGKGADVLYVEGIWVFDPLHTGWNEIHPIKVCTIVGEPGGWDGDWSTQPGDGVILRLRDAFGVARAPETQENQARPEHQWQVHPDLDACVPDIIIT